MKYKLKSDIKTFDIVELICKNRNVDYKNLDSFLSPTSDAIENPVIYKNLKEAAELILSFIKQDKKIVFIVDSDVDGYCSSAMLMNYIHDVLGYSNVFYILHEQKEHGLTPFIMNILDNMVFDMVILPDSSSSDYQQHKKLKGMGKTVLVIDHHEAEKFSDDAIVVNNQLNDGGNRTLSGAGMIMKLLEYIDNITGNNSAQDYMDLCAVALVGDCMDMTHPETRYYVQEGLRDIRNPLLFEIYNAMNDKNFKMISFDIAPTINAFIRVGDARDKMDLFNAMINMNYEREIAIRGKGTFNLKLPEYLAALSNRIKSRQSSQITKAIEEKSSIMNEYESQGLPFTICILEDEVNKNLTGLIGNRLVEKYNKPAIVIKKYGDVYRGSGRTTDTFPDFKDYLINLGYFNFCEGHQGAFGLGIDEAKLDTMLKSIKGSSLGEDADVEIVDKAYIDIVSAYDILALDGLKNHWCKGFEEPRFYIRLNNLSNIETSVVGQKKDTIRIKHNNITYIKFKCKPEEIEEFENTIPTHIELIGTFDINEWNDNLYPQVQIEKLCIFGTKIEKKEQPFLQFGIKW